jgi:hypothetical protein
MPPCALRSAARPRVGVRAAAALAGTRPGLQQPMTMLNNDITTAAVITNANRIDPELTDQFSKEDNVPQLPKRCFWVFSLSELRKQ